MTGKEWYFNQALNGVNQAIGRIIRHRNDYGCIMLLDERYAEKGFQNKLSSWIAGSVKVFENSDDTLCEIDDFFGRFERKRENSGTRSARVMESPRDEVVGSQSKDDDKKEGLDGNGSQYVKETQRTITNDYYDQLGAERQEKMKIFRTKSRNKMKFL